MIAAMSELAEYWRTRTISEAQEQGVFASPGDVPRLQEGAMILRPGITRDMFIGNIKLRCDKCGRRDPVIGVQTSAKTEGYGMLRA
jgi:hypothetical protein